MKRLAASVLITCVAGVVVAAQDSKVQRGKYLVEEVARCQECHTPRTDTNDFDRAKWMKGATLVAAPSTPIEGWHQKSPDISSTSPLWQRWGDEGIVKFLETAKNPRGGKAGAPMPAYTLSPADAEAIATYLKSLP
jgi:mono/diheme cytochrome c family protein